MASEEMRAAAQAIREAAVFTGSNGDVAEMRQLMEAGAGAFPLPDTISRRDLTVADRGACHIAAPDVRNDRGVLYFHGGGYVLGSLDTHAELMGRVSAACRAPVLGIDYRLAPEHPYPAALEDALASYEHLLVGGIPADKVVLAGDSAGGGLALACLQALQATNKPLPAGAVLFSPWSDLAGTGESVKTRAEVDPMISPALLGPMAAHYCANTKSDHPGVSPLFGNFSNLPPLLVQVGDHEVLLDDSTRLAARAQDAGVEVELEVFDEAFHVFQNMPILPEAATALESVGTFFDRVTG